MASTIERILNVEGIFYLMHKNIEVCRLELVGDGKVSSVRVNEKAEKHMPIGSSADIFSFRNWWNGRAIPETRNNVKSALEKLGYTNTSIALINNLALSLDDCYWIKPIDSNLKWEDVNLYTNDFEDVFGNLTLEETDRVDVTNKTNFNSATSFGELQKKWCIDSKNRRVLIKGNYGLSYQQSLNEVFASKIHSSLGFKNFVEYKIVALSLTNNRKGLGCSCYCFCDENIESVSLSSVYNLSKKRNDESNFDHLRKQCIQIGIKPSDFDDYFDYLILSDFLITNTDRHLNNISILRNPDTLEVLGFSPIYDFGNSMLYKTPTNDFDSIDVHHIKIHSLANEEIKMLKYVKNRNALDLNKIDLDFDIYDNDIKENSIRKNLYIDLVNRKIELIKMFQSGIDIWKH